MIDRSQVLKGMTVRSADGEKLGKVLECQTETFTIEKGFFFPKDYIANYGEISDISGDEIRLRTGKDAFTARESDAGILDRSHEESGAFTGSTTGRYGEESMRTSAEDVTVPVSEEEVDVVKRDRQTGEVRLRKDVVTENKRIDVPVTREEVRVEHLPAGERRDLAPGEADFEQKTVSMPLHEEEVEIRKRPVVKEQVRLRKDRVTEQRAADTEVRKERIDVEGEGASGYRRGPDDLDEPGMTPRTDDDIP